MATAMPGRRVVDDEVLTRRQRALDDQGAEQRRRDEGEAAVEGRRQRARADDDQTEELEGIGAGGQPQDQRPAHISTGSSGTSSRCAGSGVGRPTSTAAEAHRIGTPTGVNGMSTRQIAATEERRRAGRVGGAGAARPWRRTRPGTPRRGRRSPVRSPMPISAPTSVAVFQQTYTAMPVIQKAWRLAAGSACALAIAVDSSIVSWAATRPMSQRSGDDPRHRQPVHGVARRQGPSLPRGPPTSCRRAATTLTALNCEAPVNTSSDMTQAWATEPPAATAPTPNTKPNTPTAAPSVTEAETTSRRAAFESVVEERSATESGDECGGGGAHGRGVGGVRAEGRLGHLDGVLVTAGDRPIDNVRRRRCPGRQRGPRRGVRRYVDTSAATARHVQPRTSSTVAASSNSATGRIAAVGVSVWT